MKTFVGYTLLFLIPVILVAGLLEMALLGIPNGYAFKKAYLESHKQDIETLILGSSHGFYNIDPQYLEGHAFNAANPAQSLRYDRLILERYLKDMPNLQTVILPVGYPTLFFDLGGTPESWRLSHYALDFGFPIDPEHFQYRFLVLSKMLKWNLDDIYVHYLQGQKVYKMSNLGWGTDFGGNREGKIERAAKASIFWHTTTRETHVETNRHHLEQIARLCAENGKRLVLIHPPLHKAYRDRRNPSQIQVTETFLTQLKIEFPTLDILDYSDADDFEERDFYDGDHLNEVGAKKLSEKIDRDLERAAHGK